MLSHLGWKVIRGILRSLINLPSCINIPPLQLWQSPQSLQNTVHVAAVAQVLQTNVPAMTLTLTPAQIPKDAGSAGNQQCNLLKGPRLYEHTAHASKLQPSPATSYTRVAQATRAEAKTP